MALFTCESDRTPCLKPDASYTCVKWRFFYPNCNPRSNVLCLSTAGAWVAAVTVCQQRLF
jgi:hypothetical protein